MLLFLLSLLLGVLAGVDSGSVTLGEHYTTMFGGRGRTVVITDAAWKLALMTGFDNKMSSYMIEGDEEWEFYDKTNYEGLLFTATGPLGWTNVAAQFNDKVSSIRPTRVSGPICENKFTFPGQWDVTFQESGSVTLKNLAGDRADAYGTVDMSQIPYTGNIHHPDMTVKADLTFWFYPDEGAFYFEGDKGETTNIWKYARCSSDKIGEEGPQGVKGAEGEQGRDGASGDQGEQGTDDFCSLNTCSSEGAPGEPGYDGSDGVMGSVGDQGETGETGEMGLPGYDGDSGRPGESGPNGESGMDGFRGMPGMDAGKYCKPKSCGLKLGRCYGMSSVAPTVQCREGYGAASIWRNSRFWGLKCCQIVGTLLI